MTKTQKMKIKELAESVTVRNHVYMLVNSSAAVKKNERKPLMDFVFTTDRQILDSVLTMVTPKTVPPAPVEKEPKPPTKTKEAAPEKNKTTTPTAPNRKGVVKRVLDT